MVSVVVDFMRTMIVNGVVRVIVVLMRMVVVAVAVVICVVVTFMRTVIMSRMRACQRDVPMAQLVHHP